MASNMPHKCTSTAITEQLQTAAELIDVIRLARDGLRL